MNLIPFSRLFKGIKGDEGILKILEFRYNKIKSTPPLKPQIISAPRSRFNRNP